jgi:hypothetical protein
VGAGALTPACTIPVIRYIGARLFPQKIIKISQHSLGGEERRRKLNSIPMAKFCVPDGSKYWDGPTAERPAMTRGVDSQAIP